MQEMLPYTASPALSILMLNDFLAYLDAVDVTKVHWAQFMEVGCGSRPPLMLVPSCCFGAHECRLGQVGRVSCSHCQSTSANVLVAGMAARHKVQPFREAPAMQAQIWHA